MENALTRACRNCEHVEHAVPSKLFSSSTSPFLVLHLDRALYCSFLSYEMNRNRMAGEKRRSETKGIGITRERERNPKEIGKDIKEGEKGT